MWKMTCACTENRRSPRVRVATTLGFFQEKSSSRPAQLGGEYMSEFSIHRNYIITKKNPANVHYRRVNCKKQNKEISFK